MSRSSYSHRHRGDVRASHRYAEFSEAEVRRAVRVAEALRGKPVAWGSKAMAGRDVPVGVHAVLRMNLAHLHVLPLQTAECVGCWRKVGTMRAKRNYDLERAIAEGAVVTCIECWRLVERKAHLRAYEGEMLGGTLGPEDVEPDAN